MEKINEIINTFEGEIKREIEIEILKKFESGLNSLNRLIEQVSEKKAGEEEEIGGEETSLSLRERITNFEERLSGVIEDTNEKFANLIELTKKLETEKSLKEFITGTMQDIFGNLAEETSKEFNLSTYQTFKDIMNELKQKMETEIFTKLDKELFNLKDGFKKFENISEILENQFSSIQEAITNIKQNYQQELRAISKENEVREEQFQELEGASRTLNQEYQDIQNVVGEALVNIQQTLSKLLEQLKEELLSHEEQFLSYKTDSKTSSEEAEALKKENLKMKTELEWVSQFIEKSPKFQILYLLSNLGEANLNKIKELTKFDEGVITLSLEELKQRDLIEISEEGGDLTIKIKQKLNPLSCIELKSVYDNELIRNFQNYTDRTSFEEGFDQILAQIENYKETQREEAGYLASILYLHIHASGYHDFFERMQNHYLELKGDSFYLRLIDNALNNMPWESKKQAELEGIIDPTQLKVYGPDLQRIDEVTQLDRGNGPFQIENYRPISVLEWDNEEKVGKTELNRYTSVSDLIRWVWLNGSGTNFAIEYIDANEEKHKIIISMSESLDAQLFIKKQEILLD